MNSSVNYVDVELTLASQNPKKRAGRKIFKETRHPVYRGIRSRNCGKWVCEIREPVSQKRIWLGSYPKPEMAARAHDVAVLAMRGRSACLNFADSVWRLPVPESSSVKDIQKAAKQAAEAFRYIEQEDIVDIATSEEDIAETTTSEEDIVETSSEEDIVETTTSEDEVSLYVDEEEMFGTPGFIASMAEGLMVPPPRWTMGFWKALIHQFFKA